MRPGLARAEAGEALEIAAAVGRDAEARGQQVREVAVDAVMLDDVDGFAGAQVERRRLDDGRAVALRRERNGGGARLKQCVH